MSDGPAVTVVLPCFNAAGFIEDTLNSVVGQTHRDLEVIVVDDGSFDDSASAARRVSDPRIAVWSVANGGVARARNLGFVRRSRDSRYVLFLDADDILEPEMLATAVSFLESHPAASFVSMGLRLIDDSGSLLPEPPPWPPRVADQGFTPRRLSATATETPLATLMTGTMSIPSNTVLRCAVVEACGGFDESFGQPFEDMDLFLRAALHGPAHALEGQVLVRYRRHAGQNTAASERFEAQHEKLQRRWQSPWHLPQAHAELAAAAWRVREERLLPHLALLEGLRLVRSGNLPRGGRIIVGALRRRLTVLLQKDSGKSGTNVRPDLAD